MAAKVKVMLVDDQRSITDVLQHIIESIGAEVIAIARDGEEAIKLYKETSPHIVLMDINMPKMDGIEALKEIVRINPKACVIMLTSLNSMDVVNECLEIGAINFLLKNNTADVLEQEIRSSWKEYLQAARV